MTIGELLAQFGNKYLVAMLTTWKLTAVSFAFALLIGVAVTVMRTCPVRPLRMLGDFYVQVFRNIPGAALLMVLVYALPYLGAVLPYGNCVVIATTLIPSAFCSEYLMSGINTIGIGQIEAARSLGLSQRLTMTQIILPQAVKNILPALGNEFIMIVKDTSLASTFFIGDLMTQCLLIKGTTYLTMEPLIMVAVVYFVLTFVLSKLLAVFERRLRRGDIQ